MSQASLKSKFFKPLGDLMDLQEIPSGISGKTSHGDFRAMIYGPGVIRIQATREDTFDDFSYTIIQDPEYQDFKVEETDTTVTVATKLIKLVITKTPVRFGFFTTDGRVINQDDDALGIAWMKQEVSVYKKLQEGERFLGLGEKTGNLDRRGQAYSNWNTDAFGYRWDQDPLYCSTPFYLGIHNKLAYGIYLDNTHKSYVNFGASNNRFSSLMAEDGDMNYYFLYGENIPTILEEYGKLTGMMEMPPQWSLGYQQCRYSYYPQSEVLRIAQTFREKDIPAEVMVLDIHYMDDYKIFSWHPDFFPDPKGLMNELAKMGFHVVVILDPGIKIESGYEPYEDGKKEDVFLKYPDEDYYSAEVWPGLCHFPDFTNPKTRKWWAKFFKTYTDLGIDGFWNDMNEIASWGNAMPELIEFDYDGQGGTSKKSRNVYGFQMARSTYESARELLKGKRFFNLTRSAFSGIQRYSAVWTGDNIASDEHMMIGVRIVNSFGLTGVPFTGYDIGGFEGDPSPELFARWISIGTFCPLFRVHAAINTRDAEPWVFGEKVEEISRNYIKLRYKLMPYIYSVFYEASKKGIPVNRSLAIYYPNQELVYHHDYQHQYLFGPSIMVVALESHREITKILLPPGEWYDFYNGQLYQGDDVIYMDSPLERLPLLVKAGAIIVMQSEVPSTSAPTDGILRVHVYKGAHESTFTYYEDDGTTYDYVQGNFYRREIEFHSTLDELVFSRAEGSYVSKFEKIKLILHGFDPIEEVKINYNNFEVVTGSLAFMAPITKFDPQGAAGQPETQNVQTVQFDNDPEQILIKL